jgi:hypothetical protein
MDYIMIFVLSFAFGWVAREIYAKYTVAKVLMNVEYAVKEELKEKVVRIVIEHQNDMFYAYSFEDLSFMAQGSNRKELEDNLAKRYPGKMFGAEPDNLKNVGFTK